MLQTVSSSVIFSTYVSGFFEKIHLGGRYKKVCSAEGFGCALYHSQYAIYTTPYFYTGTQILGFLKKQQFYDYIKRMLDFYVWMTTFLPDFWNPNHQIPPPPDAESDPQLHRPNTNI